MASNRFVTNRGVSFVVGENATPEAIDKAIALLSVMARPAEPSPAAPDWAVLGPKLAEALLGAQKALRRALPHCPADSEHNGDSVFVGEWLDEVNEALALVPAA